jgi:hypothetical protein
MMIYIDCAGLFLVKLFPRKLEMGRLFGSLMQLMKHVRQLTLNVGT